MNLSTLTISSLEIARLVESQHFNVRISIERLAERGVITLPAIQEVSNEGPGPKTIKIYNLAKRDSFVVFAQLSPELTARLCDRWQELEWQHQPMTLGDTLVAQAKAFRAMERQLALVQEKQSETSTLLGQTSTRLDQVKTAGEHFTIINWSRLNGKTVTSPMASAMEGHATKYCQDNGIPTGSVPDPKFWRVNKYLNTYPKHVLDFLFAGPGLSEHSL